MRNKTECSLRELTPCPAPVSRTSQDVRSRNLPSVFYLMPVHIAPQFRDIFCSLVAFAVSLIRNLRSEGEREKERERERERLTLCVSIFDISIPASICNKAPYHSTTKTLSWPSLRCVNLWAILTGRGCSIFAGYVHVC